MYWYVNFNKAKKWHITVVLMKKKQIKHSILQTWR